MDFICIDVTQFTHNELEVFCEQNFIKKDNLFIAKERGLKKVYYLKDGIEDGLKWIGYTTKTDPEIRFFMGFKRSLSLIIPEEAIPVSKVLFNTKKEMAVDEILDKISEHGISSLTQKELDFLNAHSQKQ
jgi:hypothetical protein